jgi:hypothetical protein
VLIVILKRLGILAVHGQSSANRSLLVIGALLQIFPAGFATIARFGRVCKKVVNPMTTSAYPARGQSSNQGFLVHLKGNRSIQISLLLVHNPVQFPSLGKIPRKPVKQASGVHSGGRKTILD